MSKADNLAPSCAVVTKSGKSGNPLGLFRAVMGLLYLYPLDALNSQIYFWNKILHVSDSSSVHHHEAFHCTRSNGMCHTEISQIGKITIVYTCTL